MAYISGNTEVVNKFNQFYYDAWRTWGVYYSAAYRDLRAYAGDNWLTQEKMYLEQQKRMVLELNKIRRVINLYSGYERENRTSTVVSPIEGADEETAEQLTDVMLYIYDKANAHYTCSEAFDHSLKTGLSIIGIYMDYSRDKVNGDIKFYWKPFNALMMDPYFTKRDLSDCDQAATRDLLSKSQVKALLPFIDPSVIENIPTGIRDNKYQYLGIYRQYNSAYIAKNLLTYDQYWRRYNKEQKYLIDTKTGISQEYNGSREEEKQLKLILEQAPHLQLINSYKSTVELNIIVGGELLYQGPDPTGLDTFPFVPVICYFEPLIDTYELKIQGIVRSIRDAQRQYNRRHSQIIDLMESVINTGWIHKNGAVIDPSMLFMSGAGRNVVVNEEYDVNADIREISPPQIPPGYLAYQDIMDKNILEIPGGNDEILGISSVGDSQVSGRLAEVRASNGLKGNRGLFDNFELAKKLLGDLVLQTVQKQYTPGKVARIIGRNPTDQFFSQQFEEYDCTIKQSVLTQTQREAYYYQLLQLRSLGVAIPDDEIISAAPLLGKSRIVERMQQMQQQAEEASMQAQEDAAIERQLKLSQKEENLALAQERRARVLSDIGLAKERLSESEQNYAKAMLDNARTVAEIEDLDRRRIIDVLKLAADMHMQAQERANEQIEEDMQKAKELAEPIPIGGENG
jgi:hypothetical protein